MYLCSLSLFFAICRFFQMRPNGTSYQLTFLWTRRSDATHCSIYLTEFLEICPVGEDFNNAIVDCESSSFAGREILSE